MKGHHRLERKGDMCDRVLHVMHAVALNVNSRMHV